MVHNSTMRILFFGHLQDITLQAELVLMLGESGSDELWNKIIALHPGLAPFRSAIRLARNQEYVGSDARFIDTDEVALIPPVSGG
jgi:molybdopterin converting factor small subunit